MKRTLAQQTILVIQVMVKDDTGTLAWSLSLVTKVLILLRQVDSLATNINREARLLTSDMREAVMFTGKVMAICVIALAYGLGVIR